MKFVRRAALEPATMRLGVLCGSFHPPTCAHVALARAALQYVDEVLWVMPREFPHKRYDQVSLDERLGMVVAVTQYEPRFSVGVSDGGLFIEIARECHEVYGPDCRLYFICGRDAAERIVCWDYGRPGAIREMLEEFDLLVAPRHGQYTPPETLSRHIHALPVSPEFDEVSSTAVRERIARGQAWEHLTPESIRDRVRELYSP